MLIIQPSTELVKPGILVVSLHEGKDFSPPSRDVTVPGFLFPSLPSHEVPRSIGDGIVAAPNNHGHYPPHSLPYALLEFDRV